MKNNLDSESKCEGIQLACLSLFCMEMLEDDTFLLFKWEVISHHTTSGNTLEYQRLSDKEGEECMILDHHIYLNRNKNGIYI